jgi:hypothetical protein
VHALLHADLRPDFRLIIANAKVFNEESTHYWRQADELQAVVKRIRKAFVDVNASSAAAVTAVGEGVEVGSKKKKSSKKAGRVSRHRAAVAAFETEEPAGIDEAAASRDDGGDVDAEGSAQF